LGAPWGRAACQKRKKRKRTGQPERGAEDCIVVRKEKASVDMLLAAKDEKGEREESPTSLPSPSNE